MDLLTTLQEMLASPLMRRALLVAVLVGIAAPVMGTYLVQRRLALLGDGIGHVALTGVALGWLVGSALGVMPVDRFAVPGAVVASVVGALLIELVRARGRTSGDVALAMLFYGGIAGGVLIITISGGSSSTLTGYLFGSIATVSSLDMWLALALAVVVIGVGVGLRPALFALCHDEELARASGLPTWLLSATVSVMAALTVSVSMRVVGVLLVSALMIVPVAAAQQLTRSFRGTMRLAMAIGLVVTVLGLVVTYVNPWSPGATIVVIAIGAYAAAAVVRPVLEASRRRRSAPVDPHPEHDDDVTVTAPPSSAG
ncbi:metal ABC transporter permease [Georgenia sp. Z1344]|uniref:metal ABC transporter permease n=1 Tax=Georgenia sp. Z1344 TaxID=3416706 RepID=UPI003CEE55B0